MRLGLVVVTAVLASTRITRSWWHGQPRYRLSLPRSL